MTSIKDVSGTKTLQGFSYTRNSDGLVATATPAGSAAQAYSYDSVNDLTSDSEGSYSYDQAGNPTELAGTSPLTYNSGDELVSAGKTTKATVYTYDPEGDRVSSTPHKATPTTYTYDQADRLVDFTEGSTTATYAYNGDGLLASAKAAKTTAFVWDTAASTPLLLEAGTTSYIYGPGGLPIEQITKSGTVSFFHHDQQGSTTMLTSTTGGVVATCSYDSYGAIKTQSGTVSTQLRFDGQYLDPAFRPLLPACQVLRPGLGAVSERGPCSGNDWAAVFVCWR